MCKLMEDLIDDVVRDDRIDIAKAFIALGKLSLEDISRVPNCPYQLSRNWRLRWRRRIRPEAYEDICLDVLSFED